MRWYPSTAVSRICSSTAPEYSIPKECPGALHAANFGATAVPVIGSMPILLSQGTITSLGHFIETYGMAESEEQHGRPVPHLPPGCSRRAGGKRPWGVRERAGADPDSKCPPRQ